MDKTKDDKKTNVQMVLDSIWCRDELMYGRNRNNRDYSIGCKLDPESSNENKTFSINKHYSNIKFLTPSPTLKEHFVKVEGFDYPLLLTGVDMEHKVMYGFPTKTHDGFINTEIVFGPTISKTSAGTCLTGKLKVREKNLNGYLDSYKALLKDSKALDKPLLDFVWQKPLSNDLSSLQKFYNLVGSPSSILSSLVGSQSRVFSSAERCGFRLYGTDTFKNKPTFSEIQNMKIKFVYTNGKSYTARNVTSHNIFTDSITYRNTETKNDISRTSSYDVPTKDLVYIELTKNVNGLDKIEIIKFKKVNLKIGTPKILTEEEKGSIKESKKAKSELKKVKHEEKMSKIRKEKVVAKKPVKKTKSVVKSTKK